LGFGLTFFAWQWFVSQPVKCPQHYEENFKKTSGKIDSKDPLEIVYLFPLDFGSEKDLDFIAVELGENSRLRYIKHLGEGRYAEDEAFPLIFTEHPRDLVSFTLDGKKAFAITDHGPDRAFGVENFTFTGGQPKIVVKESSGWKDRTKDYFPEMRFFNFTLTDLDLEEDGHVDFFITSISQQNENSLLLTNNGKNKFEISNRGPSEFKDPDFCYMMVKKMGKIDGKEHLFLGACDRPPEATLYKRDRIALVDRGQMKLLPEDLLPKREKDPSWGTVATKIVDLNNDGLLDIVTSVHNYGFTQGGLQLYFNTGVGMKFRSPKTNYLELSEPEKPSFIPFVKTGDLNGDHYPEILVPRSVLFLNGVDPKVRQKFGLFQSQKGERFRDISHCLASSLSSVLNAEIRDFDADGRNDVLLMSYGGSYEIYFQKAANPY